MSSVQPEGLATEEPLLHSTPGSLSPRPPPAPASRLAAFDWLRGLVMVLMLIDHASAAFNAGRFVTDSVTLWTPGTAIPTAQFLTRWITHLCAPTFVFLAGASLAFSVHKRLASGESPRGVDGFNLRRGVLVALVDPLWMSWLFLEPGSYLLQVMYALGLSMVCMVPLRRLGTRSLAALGVGLIAGWELLLGLGLLLTPGQPPSLPMALLLSGGVFAQGEFIIGYPLLPWLGVMCLGWVFGREVLEAREPSARRRVAMRLAWCGVASLGLFLLVRGLNGYGNSLLYRDDLSLPQWLHVSKYPPSLAFAALELGLMALLLSGLWWLESRRGALRAFEPLRVLGQTAFFYYLLHAHLAYGLAALLGVQKQLGLGATYLGAAATLVVLYPACAWYRRYKAAHPHGWTRYV
jgi:uncharacterized membrane protein